MLKRAIFAFSILFTAPVMADNIVSLCARDIEGTYLGTLQNFKVRVDLVCIDDENISATVCPATGNAGTFGTDMVTNMSNAAVDGNRLIVANFALENAARASGSSKSIVSYLTLDIANLLSGQMRGVYMSGSMTEFQALSAQRIERYPKLTPAVKQPLPAASVGGVFRTDMPDDESGVNLIFDNILNTPVISIVGVKSHFVNHFTEGPAWSDSGVFSSVTAEGNGGEPDDRKLNYIRGRFFDADHLEFYLINSTRGLRGPFRASRIAGGLGPNP